MQDNNIQDQLPPMPPDSTLDGTGDGSAKKSDVKDVKDDLLLDVVKKIKEAENVLVALSNDPSVDEMAAAIGLTMALDVAGKHATAIYSGKTPNVLEFLNPEETFETTTDSLQDFIIALNKDKADHLRYKIDGDYVKVYITPYKTTIEEDDLEFSRGDYNIDLVISMNVPAATELDGALKEHGRIMHDATSINITNGAPGKFGDIEWADDKASSISEMVTNLALELNNKKLDSGIATALLTGLVAATDKFTNPATTPDVMMMAAKLMGFGADQQVVIQNISQELEFKEREDVGDDDRSSKKTNHNELSISHDEKDEDKDEEEKSEEKSEDVEEKPEESGIPGGGALAAQMNSEQSSDNEVQALMQSAINPMGTGAMGSQEPATIAGVEVSSVAGDSAGYAGGALADQILNNMNNANNTNEPPKQDYGQMIDQALAEPMPGETVNAPAMGAQGPMMGGAPEGTANPDMSSTMVTPDTGMPAGIAGPGMMGGVAPELGPNPTMLANPNGPSQDEIEAMNIINQAKQGTGETPSLSTNNGELPKIVPTGGSLGYDSPAASGQADAGISAPGVTLNPAMAQAPGVENMPAVNDVPTMNFGQPAAGMPTPEGSNAVVMPNSGMVPEMNAGAGPLPMPGQELAPPPMTPTPDFGAMPPVQAAPTNLAPDMTQGMGIGANIGVTPTMPAPQPMPAPQDPGAFQIPGMQQ